MNNNKVSNRKDIHHSSMLLHSLTFSCFAQIVTLYSMFDIPMFVIQIACLFSIIYRKSF